MHVHDRERGPRPREPELASGLARVGGHGRLGRGLLAVDAARRRARRDARRSARRSALAGAARDARRARRRSCSSCSRARRRATFLPSRRHRAHDARSCSPWAVLGVVRRDVARAALPAAAACATRTARPRWSWSRPSAGPRRRSGASSSCRSRRGGARRRARTTLTTSRSRSTSAAPARSRARRACSCTSCAAKDRSRSREEREGQGRSHRLLQRRPPGRRRQLLSLRRAAGPLVHDALGVHVDKAASGVWDVWVTFGHVSGRQGRTPVTSPGAPGARARTPVVNDDRVQVGTFTVR